MLSCLSIFRVRFETFKMYIKFLSCIFFYIFVLLNSSFTSIRFHFRCFRLFHMFFFFFFVSIYCATSLPCILSTSSGCRSRAHHFHYMKLMAFRSVYFNYSVTQFVAASLCNTIFLSHFHFLVGIHFTHIRSPYILKIYILPFFQFAFHKTLFHFVFCKLLISISVVIFPYFSRSFA